MMKARSSQGNTDVPDASKPGNSTGRPKITNRLSPSVHPDELRKGSVATFDWRSMGSQEWGGETVDAASRRW
jgi:hypothetical protein